ncbi:conserved hypothetical protein [Crenothrix polyspora]|uniref:CopG family transcriptional regulator n=1 Tax=Crenothrix polyspora TaxID=360316 RepID=A0A1R4H295_9GAMM|nr:hypothetical protein [Crenothrix polyspora]SJM90361.1 conserved hypothetical protein [Crenothrix polyspora]
MIALPEHLEKSFLRMAEREHKPADKLLAQLVEDYLEDHIDIQLAEKAIERIESGQDILLDWQDVKAGLYDVDN